MVKRFYCLGLVLLLVCSFCAPVFAGSTAHPNQLGVEQFDIEFLGYNPSSASVSSLSNWYPAVDGSVTKFFYPYDSSDGSAGYDLTDKHLFLFYSVPDLRIYEGKYQFDIFLSLADRTEASLNYARFYYGLGTGSDAISLSGGWSLSVDSIKWTTGYRSLNMRLSYDNAGYFFNAYDYIVLELVFNSGYLDRDITFAESATLSGGTSSDIVTLSPSGSGSISTTGRVGFASLTNAYSINSSMTNTYNNVGSALLNISPYGSSGHYVAHFTTLDILSKIFGSATTLTPTSSTIIRTADSGTVSMPSYTGSLTSTQASRSISGSVSAKTNTTVMISSSARVVAGNDGGLVDEVFNQGVTLDSMDTELIDQGTTLDGIKTEQADQGKTLDRMETEQKDQGKTLDRMETEQTDQGKTLDDIAANMQTVVDDLEAHYAAAEDIGGSTSQSTINSTQATLSSGVQAMDSFVDNSVSQSDNLIFGSSGYRNFIGMAFPVMVNMGANASGWSPLSIAIFLSVSISVVGFFIRRIL